MTRHRIGRANLFARSKAGSEVAERRNQFVLEGGHKSPHPLSFGSDSGLTSLP